MKNSNKKIDSAKRKFIYLSVFAIIPAVLLFSCWRFFSSQHLMNSRQVITNEADKELLNLRWYGNNRVFIQHELNSLIEQLDQLRHEKNKSRIELAINRFRNIFKTPVELFFFDSDSKLIQLEQTPLRNKAVLQKIYNALSEAETKGNTKLLKRNKAFFDAFLGGITSEEIAKEKSTPIRVMMAGKPHWFYWNTSYSDTSQNQSLGIIAYMPITALPENFAIKKLLYQKNEKSYNDCVFGMVDMGKEKVEKIILPVSKKQIQNFSKVYSVISDMRANLLSYTTWDQYIVITKNYDSDRVLFCLDKKSLKTIGIIDLFIKLLLMLYLISVSRMIIFTDIFISTKSYINTLVTVIAVPIITLLLIGVAYSQICRQLLEQNYFSELSNHIENIDENYQTAISNLAASYRNLAKQDCIINLKARELESKLKELSDRGLLSRFYLVDRNGNTRFNWSIDKNREDIIGRLLPAITRNIFITQRGESRGLKDEVTDMMVQSMSAKYADLLGDTGKSLFKTFENIDQINEFQLANQQYYVYAKFVDTPKNAHPMLMFVWLTSDSYSEKYIQQQVQKNISQKHLDIRLAIMPMIESLPPLPKTIRKYPFIFRLSEQVINTGTRQFAIDFMENQQYLIAAAPLKNVPDYILFAMHTKQPIDERILWFEALLILILILSIAIPVLLYRSNL